MDKRGIHNNRPNAISEELKQKVDAHIRKFPYEISHYGRERTKKRYLSPELSVRQMYKLFVQEEFPAMYKLIKDGEVELEDLQCPIRLAYYRLYFKTNFNYGFGQPKTDVCGTCAELQVRISSEKNSSIRARLDTQLKVHKKRAATFYDELKKCTTQAKESAEHETICFDFEQNIPFPHLPVGEIFYKRQLWFYNFCVHSCKTSKPVMYTWPEPTARRGCSQTISCLYSYNKSKVDANIKHLSLFSDRCRGQNLNHAMIRFLFSLVHEGNFESIDFHIPFYHATGSLE